MMTPEQLAFLGRMTKKDLQTAIDAIQNCTTLSNNVKALTIHAMREIPKTLKQLKKLKVID